MGEAIKKQMNLWFCFDVEKWKSNGDPDAGNMPRIDPKAVLELLQMFV